jgi:hypothetical protein
MTQDDWARSAGTVTALRPPNGTEVQWGRVLGRLAATMGGKA